MLTGTVESWTDVADDASTDFAADWTAGSLIYMSEYDATSTGGESGPGSGPTATSGAASTITKIIYETGTATTTFTNTIGWLSVAAVSRYGFRGVVETDYNLNYASASETVDVCTAGYYYVYGVASPKPEAWSDIPESVSFFSTVTVNSDKYSQCVYTNAAALSAGDGGKLSCDGYEIGCYMLTYSVLGCNADALIGWDTKVKPVIGCPVTSTTTSHYITTTGTETVTTMS